MLKCIDKGKKYLDINPFHATDLFWYPLKTSENQRFSDIFRGYQKRSVVLNRLRSCNISLEITVTWYLIGWPNVCTQSDLGKLWFRVKYFAKSSPCKLAYWALLLSNLFCVYYPRKFQVSSRIRRSGKWLSLQTRTLQNFQIHSNNLLARADELFEYVWPFCGVGVYRVKKWQFSQHLNA